MTSKTKVRLLSIAALGGMISGLGFAIAAAPELDSLYEEYIAAMNFSLEEPLTIRLRYIIKAAKVLDKSIISACISAGCIFAMKGQIGKSEAALCGLLVKTLNKDLPELSPKEERKLKTSKSEIILYDAYTAQYIPCNLKVLERAVKRCNIRLHQFYRVTLNRFLKELGGDPYTVGDYIGWDTGCEKQLIFWGDEEPYIAIDLSDDFDMYGRNIVRLNFVPDPEKF